MRRKGWSSWFPRYWVPEIPRSETRRAIQNFLAKLAAVCADLHQTQRTLIVTLLMSLLWLRFALACYFIGLTYAFFALTRTSDVFNRIALHAASLGMVFHFVSLVELFLSGHVVWASVHNGESLLAFFSMIFFMIVYAVYQTTSPGVVVFPIVFFLTFVAAVGQQPFVFTSSVQRGWLIPAHIPPIFTGYA